MGFLEKTIFSSFLLLSSYSLSFSQQVPQDSLDIAMQGAKEFIVEYNGNKERPFGAYMLQMTLGDRHYLYELSDSDLKITVSEPDGGAIFYDGDLNGIHESDSLDYCVLNWNTHSSNVSDLDQPQRMFYEFLRDIKAMYAERTNQRKNIKP